MNGGDSKASTASVLRMLEPAIRQRVVKKASGTPKSRDSRVVATATNMEWENARR